MVGFLEWGHDMHSRVLLENDSRAVGPASGTPLHASPSKWTLCNGKQQLKSRVS